MSHIVTDEMFDAFLSIKNKYVHDEESFRQFYFYMSDFNQMVRIDMDDTATRLKLKDHYKAAAERQSDDVLERLLVGVE